METEMKLDKIEKSGSGVKFAHINLFIDVECDASNWCVGSWKLQCTGMAIVVKGNHNINSLNWFLNKIGIQISFFCCYYKYRQLSS